MSDAVIRSRIDPDVKLEAQALLSRFGLSMSDAIRLFLHQVVMEKGLPFEIRLPEVLAREHDRWFRRQVESAVKEANDPRTVFTSHADVRSRWNGKRKELRSRARGGKKV